ncbi:MAG TPA: hypothetical protein VFI86_06140 [Burkholderiales bacterium]|nr:hypothetical protein [Burkholderiales bacterium]
MNRQETLVRELERLERLDRDSALELDNELEGEDAEMELELLADRVRAARLAGA